jgi:hypothetical protein
MGTGKERERTIYLNLYKIYFGDKRGKDFSVYLAQFVTDFHHFAFFGS